MCTNTIASPASQVHGDVDGLHLPRWRRVDKHGRFHAQPSHNYCHPVLAVAQGRRLGGSVCPRLSVGHFARQELCHVGASLSFNHTIEFLLHIYTIHAG